MLGSTTAGSMAAGRALGPVRHDVECAHMCGHVHAHEWLHHCGAAGLSCPTQPTCLTAKYAQNGSFSNKIVPKSRPLRPSRRLRRRQSCSHVAPRDDFCRFCPIFPRFSSIFFYCGNALCCSSSSQWYNSLLEVRFRWLTLSVQSSMGSSPTKPVDGLDSPVLT